MNAKYVSDIKILLNTNTIYPVHTIITFFIISEIRYSQNDKKRKDSRTLSTDLTCVESTFSLSRFVSHAALPGQSGDGVVIIGRITCTKCTSPKPHRARRRKCIALHHASDGVDYHAIQFEVQETDKNRRNMFGTAAASREGDAGGVRALVLIGKRAYRRAQC